MTQGKWLFPQLRRMNEGYGYVIRGALVGRLQLLRQQFGRFDEVIASVDQQIVLAVDVAVRSFIGQINSIINVSDGFACQVSEAMNSKCSEV